MYSRTYSLKSTCSKIVLQYQKGNKWAIIILSYTCDKNNISEIFG